MKPEKKEKKTFFFVNFLKNKPEKEWSENSFSPKKKIYEKTLNTWTNILSFCFTVSRFQLSFSSFSPKNKFFCWKKSFFLLRKWFFVSHMEKHTLSWFHSWKRKKSFLLKKSFYLVSEKVKKIFFVLVSHV